MISKYPIGRHIDFLKYVLLVLVCLNLAYFGAKYKELSDTVELLKQQDCAKTIFRKSAEETEPEPQLEYSQRKYYPYIFNEPNKCKNTDGEEIPVFLLVIVKSTVKQFDRRKAIRVTWGNETFYPGITTKRLFLLARGTDEKAQALLDHESRTFHDIIQGDFQDSFRNLTIKDIMFMRWMTDHCPQAKYIFKGDDDVFVNMNNIMNFLFTRKPEEGRDLFTGSVLYPSPRIKDPKSKYYVSTNLWSEKYYPPYVSGGGFVMSSVMSKRIFEITKITPLIPIDDAFLGVCLKKLGMKPQNHKGFKSWGVNRPKDICIYREIMTLHKLNSEDMVTMWKALLNSSDKDCSKSFVAMNTEKNTTSIRT